MENSILAIKTGFFKYNIIVLKCIACRPWLIFAWVMLNLPLAPKSKWLYFTKRSFAYHAFLTLHTGVALLTVQFWYLNESLYETVYSNLLTSSDPAPRLHGLTLNVRGPSYLGLTRSISLLLMPWLLTSPGHQQQCYWLCRMGRLLSYLRKGFNYLRRINVEKWYKM